MKKCINCVWKGDKVTDKGFCPVCGDFVKDSEEKDVQVIEPKKKNVFDFNNDGKVDKNDVKLAAKLMGKTRQSKRSKK